ncbi:MAG: hypothetical protein WED01_15970 [Candidatus Rokuibacteriota bacterium]
MARHRPSPPHAGLRALATAFACVALTAAVLRFDVAGGLTVPAWTAVLPLLVYVALAAITLGRASLRPRLVWLAGACATHALVVVATAAVVAAAGADSLATALPSAIVESPLATVIFLAGVPLTLLPFRGRLLPRPAARASSPRPAAPAPPRTGRPASAPVAGETPFAREARRRMAVAAPPPVQAPAAAAAVPSPAPVLVLRPPARPVVAPMPVRAAAEPTVTIAFERIAAQLPADVFLLPMDRLAESMRSPHELLVPRSLVVAQLAEGQVEVAWALVEDQFPTLAFALEASEIRRRYPELRLLLPLDLVVSQLPPAVFSAAAPVAELGGLDRYPAPFQPSSGATVPAVPPASRPATPAAAPPPVAPAAPAPSVTLAPAIVEAPVVPRPPAAAPASAAPAVAVTAVPPSEAALLAQGQRLATRLVAFGPLEVGVRRLNGTTVLSLVTAGRPHEAIERAAARCAPLLAAAHQVTIHTDRVSMLLTRVCGGVLVIGLRAGAPLAMLEILVVRACGGEPAGGAPAGVPRGLAAADVDGRVAALGGALQGFGPVVPAAFVDRAGGLDVYVFSTAAEAQVAGEEARVVWQALVHEGERDLGRARSVVLREGPRRTVVYPVAAARRPAMLAAAGVLALPGLAYRQAARAAERLAAV